MGIFGNQDRMVGTRIAPDTYTKGDSTVMVQMDIMSRWSHREIDLGRSPHSVTKIVIEAATGTTEISK